MIKLIWDYRNPTNEERYEAEIRKSIAKKQRVNFRFINE